MKDEFKILEEELKALGVVDVKFSRNLNKGLTLEQFKSGLVDCINAYINGNSTVVTNFDDEIIPNDLNDRVERGKMKQIMKAAKKEFPDWLGEV